MIVNKFFIDKLSHKTFEPGDVYPPDGLEVTEERLAELSLKGYIKEKAEKVEKKEAKTDKKPAGKKTAKKSTKKE